MGDHSQLPQDSRENSDIRANSTSERHTESVLTTGLMHPSYDAVTRSHQRSLGEREDVNGGSSVDTAFSASSASDDQGDASLWYSSARLFGRLGVRGVPPRIPNGSLGERQSLLCHSSGRSDEN